MATTVARLEAVLSADTDKYDRAIDRADDKTHRFGATAGRAFKLIGAAAIAGTGAAVGGIGFAVKAASDLGEQITKSQVVFGKNAKEVQAWSKGLTRNFGLSQRAALEAAGTYGNMLKPLGLAPPLVKEMSTRMTELAGDLASFNNASPKDTLDAIRAGLAGETEPLKRFGISLNDARLKEEALRMGLIETTQGTLPAAIKAQAAYSLVMKDSTDAQGDFARTQNSMPNLLRTFKGELENAAASLGQVFLPLATQLLKWAVDILPRVFALVGALTDRLKPGFEAVGSAIPSLIAHLRNIWAWINEHVIPIVLSLRDTFVAMMQRIRAVLDENGPELQRIFGRIGEAMRLIWAVAGPLLRLFFVEILPVALGIAIKAIDLTSAAIEGIVKGFRWIGEHGAAIFRAIAESKAIALATTAFDKLRDIIVAIKNGIQWLIDNIGRIPKPSLPSLGGGLIGDPRDPGGTGPTSISPRLWDELAGAHAFGLALSSGYRPGAVTRSGHPSDHGVYPSKAIDVAGSSSAMAGFFRWLIGQRDVKQAFYDPLGSIFGGMLSSYREGGHSDHVHVATYDKGGWLKPGLTLAMNNTGRSEPVGGNVVIPVSIGGEHIATVVFDMLRRKAQVFERNNQRPAFGSS